MNCEWVSRDDEGRPSCVHGAASSAGIGHWRCPLKHLQANRRYYKTEKGREAIRRRNAQPSAQSAKALHELTRVRVS